MTTDSTGPGEPNLSEKELEEQYKAFQASQQIYLEKTFKWLIDYVTGFFPGDQLAIRDMDLEVHFVHRVMDEGKTIGALVYRFRKFVNKKEYFEEMAEDYRQGLDVPEVLFVDSESSHFAEPATLEVEGNFIEISPEKLPGKIKELREDLKRRVKLRHLRESL